MAKANDTRLAYWRERYTRQKAERDAKAPPDALEGLTEVETAYIAGIVDGEGCLSIGKNAKGLHIPCVQVIMTEEPLLTWLAQKLGVPCSALNRKVPAHYKPQFEVRLTGRRAVFLCMMLEPFLRVKHEQCRLIIAFGETYQSGKEKAVTQEVTALRESYKQQMHALNFRGKAAPHK